MESVPKVRITACNDHSVNESGSFVLYWMIANRRATWNFALQRAVDWATRLGKPLVVLEALRIGYEWASHRLHAFVIEGMVENHERFAKSQALYYPYLEPEPDAGKGLLRSLGDLAAVVVTDDYPCFFLPRMVAAAAETIAPRLEMVDSNGIIPVRLAEKAFARAYDFRRFIQRELYSCLDGFPEPDPLKEIETSTTCTLPKAITERWPPMSRLWLAGEAVDLSSYPLPGDPEPCRTKGGTGEAEELLLAFLRRRLADYEELGNHPDEDCVSGLSPYLHFGHISSHQIVREILDSEDWSKGKLSPEAKGKRSGWWGISQSAEAFLDQLVTWRELGFNACVRLDKYDEYSSLPEWAQKTLWEHAGDERPYVYSFDELESASTHDRVWNAAQRQLVTEGRLHNYLRMLWGKKILEWSPTPWDASSVMLELNNRYALDGRDPNSYSGIFWVLGRHDRPWGPERPIFGKIRYMSSLNARRKLRMEEYLNTYATD